jgi:hypothetical protein
MANEIIKLWIIDREAGISVFDQSFQELPSEMDSDLVGGFFIALMSFSQEIAKQSIEFLQLKQIRFYFYIMKYHLLILASSLELDQENAAMISAKIQKRFEEKYQNVIGDKFVGDVSVFNDFGDDVEEELGQECTCHSHFEEKPELLHKHYTNMKKEWRSLRTQIKDQLQQFNACTDKTGLLCQMKCHFNGMCNETIKKHKKS